MHSGPTVVNIRYAVGMKYDFTMENCLGTDYPNLHELNKNCYGFSPASVQNGPQAAAAAAAADEQTMYKVICRRASANNRGHRDR